MHKLSLPRRTYGDKAAGSKLIHFTRPAMMALAELAQDKRETATACFAVELLHAVISSNELLIDALGERLYLALPISTAQLRANLDGLTCAVEQAELRRLTTER